ncbi:MAG: esterase [Bryobacterales bacterium]|nr:esterase [Bryobacterales bacterium]
MRSAFLLVLSVCLHAADPTFRDVTAWAKSGKADELRNLLTADKLGKGSARFDFGPDFLFAIETKSKPQIVINDDAPRRMTRVKGSDIWYATATLKTSRTHNYRYLIDGKPFGGQTDVPAWGPYAYPMPNVPAGKLDGKHVHESRIYPGMKCDYWVYVPAQYDANSPAPVMVWQDGEVFVPRELPYRSQIIWDNLTHLKKIPPVIHILISPGYVGSTRIRSEQYDMMDDTYVRFLRDEILTEVGKKYKLRQDGYSRAIGGDSSGGICAFNAAYTHPELFTRVLSRIGSFTSIQWKPGVIDGGNVYPYKVRKEPKRNIRAWLQEGSEDLENDHGSWPATNLALANSLKLKEYDFYLSWGNGTHARMGGNVEMAEELIWLWRGYDPAKTSDTFIMDPAEKDKPFFRVKALNRETPLP